MDELVSKKEAIEAIYDGFSYAYCDNCDKYGDDDRCGDDCHRKYINWAASKSTIERAINKLPSVSKDNEEETAEWIKEDRGRVEYTAVCSKCGYDTFWSDIEYFRYCPGCGKKMKVTDE